MAKSSDSDLPSTLERSPAKAGKIYEETLASAEATYHDEKTAHRVAWGAVKNEFEKVDDHWEAKAHRGPSDERARRPHDEKIAGSGETYGGVDVEGSSRDELFARAERLGVEHTAKMTKAELGRAIEKKQTAATARARK